MNHVRSRVDLQYDVKQKRFLNFFGSLLLCVEKATKIHCNSCDLITIINHAGIRDDLYIQIVWEKSNFETARLNHEQRDKNVSLARHLHMRGRY